MSRLELGAEFDLAAGFFAVDQDKVRVVRIQKALEFRVAVVLSLIISRSRH